MTPFFDAWSDGMSDQSRREAEAYLAECEPRRWSSSGSRPWVVMHLPTGAAVSTLPEPITTAAGTVLPGRGAKFFRLKRDAAAALTRMREMVANA